MDGYIFTRNRVEGAWDLTHRTLAPAIKTEFPGRSFGTSFEGEDVKVTGLEPVLSPLEVGRLTALVETLKATFDPLAAAKKAKVEQIRRNTDALIAQGAIYENRVYMSTQEGRFDVLALYTIGIEGWEGGRPQDAPGFWPKKVSTSDGETQTAFKDAEAFLPFFDKMMDTYAHWKESGQVLRQQVTSAETMSGIKDVVDDRTWPWDGR